LLKCVCVGATLFFFAAPAVSTFACRWVYVCRYGSVLENESGQLPAQAKEDLIHELEQQERKFTRLKRAKLSADDFEPLTIIGGAVHVDSP
jgi:hypothetical protein